MIDLKALLKPDQGQPATLVHLVDKKGFEAWLKDQPARVRKAVEGQGFKGEGYQLAVLPGERDEWAAVLGVANVDELSPWCLAKAAESLPEGTYRVAGRGPGPAMLGWLLGQYRFERYKKEPSAKGARVLLTDEPARIDETVLLAESTFLVRDLVNIPAGDLGPAELEMAVLALADESGAKVTVTRDAALDEGYPMVAAVGQGAAPDRAPRMIELHWGKDGAPRLAIVGKGVCFDSGGLDLKPAAWMRNMKKDMGGAAHALALAGLVIAAKLPVRLHLLIPAVENAVSGSAYRPGDIVKSRKGDFIEIDNTDAEGRLILADALARAAESQPALIVDFATLTGAARVALGPDIPALFANRDELAAAAEQAGRAVDDPLWRMPLWDPDEDMLKSDVADIANASTVPMAGCILAALFLKRFVPDAVEWAHLDTYAWRDRASPGRPKGGDALGLRAIFAMLETRFGTA